MTKLSINLLPPELEAAKKQKKRFSKSLKLSIIFLAVVIGVAAVVLSIRLSQNVILSNTTKDLEKAKATLNSPEYNQKEGVAITLKNRLESIGTLLTQETYASYAFNLLTGLVPANVNLTGFSVDSKGVAKITAETNNISALDSFFNQILNPDKNQKKITAVNIDSLSRSKSDIYRTELSVNLPGAKTK